MTRQKFILRADGTISIASLALRAQSPNSVSPLCFCLEPEQYAHSTTPECDITHTRRALLRPALGIHSFLFRIFAPQLLSAFRADEATTLLSTRTINAARMTTNNPLVRWRSRGWPESAQPGRSPRIGEGRQSTPDAVIHWVTPSSNASTRCLSPIASYATPRSSVAKTSSLTRIAASAAGFTPIWPGPNSALLSKAHAWRRHHSGLS